MTVTLGRMNWKCIGKAEKIQLGIIATRRNTQAEATLANLHEY